MNKCRDSKFKCKKCEYTTGSGQGFPVVYGAKIHCHSRIDIVKYGGSTLHKNPHENSLIQTYTVPAQYVQLF